ncbi:MAG: hypothetical protein FWF10_08315 [Clostridiales bacterium]|nr:hypothetical protein [Clostridiales bacterium]
MPPPQAQQIRASGCRLRLRPIALHLRALALRTVFARAAMGERTAQRAAPSPKTTHTKTDEMRTYTLLRNSAHHVTHPRHTML